MQLIQFLTYSWSLKKSYMTQKKSKRKCITHHPAYQINSQTKMKSQKRHCNGYAIGQWTISVYLSIYQHRIITSSCKVYFFYQLSFATPGIRAPTRLSCNQVSAKISRVTQTHNCNWLSLWIISCKLHCVYNDLSASKIIGLFADEHMSPTAWDDNVWQYRYIYMNFNISS